MSAYESLLGKREVETSMAETFAAEFPVVVGRTVKLIAFGESPDCTAFIDGAETGIELTAIKAGNADDVVSAMLRLAKQKHESYSRRELFAEQIVLLGHLDWPSREGGGTALYDEADEIYEIALVADFAEFGFTEIWLMDSGPKYSSRHDPRCPADFFCFSPPPLFGFYQRPRKRRPYWSIVQDWFS